MYSISEDTVQGLLEAVGFQGLSLVLVPG